MNEQRFARPVVGFLAGAGMAAGSFLTIRHFFQANFPATIYEGSFCDLSAFFNCDSSAFSSISTLFGAPIGTYGLVLGLVVALAASFAGAPLVRTTRTLLWLNLLGVLALLGYSVFVLGSLCLLCSVYYVFSFLAVWAAGTRPGISARHLAAMGVVMVLAVLAMREYRDARLAALSGGDSARIASQFLALPTVPDPSVLSDDYVYRAGESFDRAPLRVVAYEDFLCSDCLYLGEQLKRLAPDYTGKLSVIFQHFPLDAACNDVVEKDKHPGACDLAYMAAYAPDRFAEIYDRVFAEQVAAKEPAWRLALAGDLGIEAALTDSAARARIRAIVGTGAEYAKTSEEYAHGIRSTPTLIINGRMVIGTFPDEYLRAMFDAALAEADTTRFIEAWVE